MEDIKIKKNSENFLKIIKNTYKDYNEMINKNGIDLFSHILDDEKYSEISASATLLTTDAISKKNKVFYLSLISILSYEFLFIRKKPLLALTYSSSFTKSIFKFYLTPIILSSYVYGVQMENNNKEFINNNTLLLNDENLKNWYNSLNNN